MSTGAYRNTTGRAGLRKMASALCLLTILSTWGVAAMAADERSSVERRALRIEDRSSLAQRPDGSWQTLLRFDKPAVYEYRLWREDRGRLSYGQLSIQVTASYIAFAYELDGKKDGTLAQTGAAAPGEALMAALLASSRWSAADIRLIWTPFMITRWAAEFARMPWRTGPAWATRSGVTEQFSIDRVLRDSRDNTIFRGALRRGGRTVLDVDINLDLPLPEYIRWVDDSGVEYAAEIVPANKPATPAARQIPSITGK